MCDGGDDQLTPKPQPVETKPWANLFLATVPGLCCSSTSPVPTLNLVVPALFVHFAAPPLLF